MHGIGKRPPVGGTAKQARSQGTSQTPSAEGPLRTTHQSKHNRKAGRADKESGNHWQTNGSDANRSYFVRDRSAAVNPYSSQEVRAMLERHAPGDLFNVDPKRVRTMHAGIGDTFGDGRPIQDTVDALKTPGAAKKIPSIKLAAVEIPRKKWEGAGKGTDTMLFTEDHRRLVAARKAGLPQIQAQMKAEPSVVGNYTTKNKGTEVEIRHYHESEEGRHQGGNKTTFPSSGRVYKYGDSEG